ncbi:AAA domain-containing protein [Streptomyces sp. 12257]|nr:MULTISPECIES: AAA domain-containing protein [Streptomyces]MDI5912384.1 AAA domain-containing protein [Streptomyces sp. 12257]
MLKQPPTFLIEALRDGIAQLGEHPLAAALAARSIGGAPGAELDPPGFHPAQADAYRACLGEGVHLVWGPPGTGKTTVLKRAIGDLIARGERVLLVSATNIAVDNALLGVVREKRHSPGEIVRVGPPHLKEVAEDPSVSLPLMVRTRLAQTAQRRSAVEAELVDIRDRAGQLAAMDAALAGFDSAGYFAALQLLRTPEQDLASALARSDAADDRYAQAARDMAETAEAAKVASDRAAAAEPSREVWREVNRLCDESARVRQAAEHRAADALLAAEECRPLRNQVKQWEAKGSVARWRAREKLVALQEQLADAEEQAEAARQQCAPYRRRPDLCTRCQNHGAVRLRPAQPGTDPAPRHRSQRHTGGSRAGTQTVYLGRAGKEPGHRGGCRSATGPDADRTGREEELADPARPGRTPPSTCGRRQRP